VFISSISLCKLFIKSCTVVPDCSTPMSNCSPPAVPPPLGYYSWPEFPSLSSPI
jgi:hypothetical protein